MTAPTEPNPIPIDLTTLRRWPDVEAENLYASDPTDRYLLEYSAPRRRTLDAGELVIIGDRYGALTLGALAAGAPHVRVHQDALSGELALAANATRLGIAPERYQQHALEPALVRDAALILLQLPRSLDALHEIADTIARHAPAAAVLAGGRVKHLSPRLATVLLRSFQQVNPTRAHQKSRLYDIEGARPRVGRATPPFPTFRDDPELGITLAAYGAAFGGAAVDPGSRLLLHTLAGRALPNPAGTASTPMVIDLGCGTGVLAATLARRYPHAAVIATDQSRAAVQSAQLTMTRNGLHDRVRVVRDDGLSSRADASADLVVLNPPFHMGATVHAGIAEKLIRHAARVLRPGGELWLVHNSHLRYRPMLERLIGPTVQCARDRTYTVTVSTRSSGR